MKKLLLSALALLGGMTANAENLWTGSNDLGNWNWETRVEIDAAKFNDVQPGAVLTITFENVGEGAVYALKDRTDWNNLLVGATYMGVGVGETSSSITLTGVQIQAIRDNGFGLQGMNMTVTSVDYTNPSEEYSLNNIWIGSFASTWSTAERIPGSSFAKVRAGDVIRVHFTTEGEPNVKLIYVDTDNNWNWTDFEDLQDSKVTYENYADFTLENEDDILHVATYGIGLTGADYTAISVELIPADSEPDARIDLPLNNLNSGWDATYDSETHTITSNGGGKGWWLDARNYSYYDYLVIQFDPVLKNTGSLVVEYNNAASQTFDLLIGQKTIVVSLSEEAKSSVKQIFIYGTAGNTYTLSAAYVATEAYITENGIENEVEEVEVDPFVELNPVYATGGWGDREYDTQTFDGTIVGDGAASGWWLGGKNYSDYDKVYVELSAINIPQHEVEGEMQAGYAQLFVQCGTGEEGETSNLTCGFGTHLYAVVDFDELKNQTRQIVIQGSAGVTFTIAKACVCTNEYFEENILPNLPADPAPSGATAIETINNEQADNAWYTLEGVRVMAPVKGLYIHNGKKVMVK